MPMSGVIEMREPGFVRGSSGEAAATRRRWRRFFEFKADIPHSWTIVLGALVWVFFFGLRRGATTKPRNGRANLDGTSNAEPLQFFRAW